MPRPRIDARALPPGVWFVRSGQGRGLLPVTVEGKRVLMLFVAGMAGSAALGGGLAILTGSVWWLAIFAAGAILSGSYFIVSVQRHGDKTINAMDLMTGSGR